MPSQALNPPANTVDNKVNRIKSPPLLFKHLSFRSKLRSQAIYIPVKHKSSNATESLQRKPRVFVIAVQL